MKGLFSAEWRWSYGIMYINTEACLSRHYYIPAGTNGKADGLAALRTMSSDSDDSAVLVGRPSAEDGAPLTLSTDQILADKCVRLTLLGTEGYNT